jgi:hypothetical protein
MDYQKATHWKEFLNNVSNVWNVNRFTKGASTPVQVLTLRMNGRTATQDKDKAEMLMDAFFLVPPIPEIPDH